MVIRALIIGLSYNGTLPGYKDAFGVAEALCLKEDNQITLITDEYEEACQRGLNDKKGLTLVNERDDDGKSSNGKAATIKKYIKRLVENDGNCKEKN